MFVVFAMKENLLLLLEKDNFFNDSDILLIFSAKKKLYICHKCPLKIYYIN